MKAKRWTLGVVLAAAVSLWGLIEADASPFSSHVLSDDLSNQVNGSAPDASGSSDGSSGSSTSGGSKDNNGNDKKVDQSCPEGGTCVDDEISKTNNGGSTK